MKKQAVLSYMLIFLFAFLLLYFGLNLCERGLREISGHDGLTGAFLVNRSPAGVWMVTFAGRNWPVCFDRLKNRLFFWR